MDHRQTLTEAPYPNRVPVIFVIGCPGSGKGTLCNLLAQQYNCYHLSVGDLLRRMKTQDIHPFEELTAYIQAGTLVPTATIVKVLKYAIEGISVNYRAVLIDGFPRRLDQGRAAEDQSGKPDLVLSFECEESTAMDRYLTRRLEGRLDDNEETFRRRYAEFQHLNPAVLEYYRSSSMCVSIDTNDKTDISFARLVAALEQDEAWASISG